MATKNTKTDYEPNKDQLVAVIGYVRLSENLAIEVALRSYDGSPTKVSVMKVGKRKADGTRRGSTKLGRLNLDVAGKVAMLMSRAAAFKPSPAEAEASSVQAA